MFQSYDVSARPEQAAPRIKALRARFDTIKADSFDKGLSEFERTLNAIGVIAKPG